MQAKAILLGHIDAFVQQRIILADQNIAEYAQKKISSDDTILVYASSHSVIYSLIKAHENNIQFNVIVVDSRPKLEGLETLSKLTRAGISCKYVQISALSYVMKEVSKVFLGAHAILSNGYVMSRVGTCVVAMMAKACNIPVVVFCERYKFADRSQTDAFVSNDIGDPDELAFVRRSPSHVLPLPSTRHRNLEAALRHERADLSPNAALMEQNIARVTTMTVDAYASSRQTQSAAAAQSQLASWRFMPNLKILNLLHDLTRPEFVDAIITEDGPIPCSSAPVVVREFLQYM
jgi:translation initiation factor eIF-2B subunit delta